MRRRVEAVVAHEHVLVHFRVLALEVAQTEHRLAVAEKDEHEWDEAEPLHDPLHDAQHVLVGLGVAPRQRAQPRQVGGAARVVGRPREQECSGCTCLHGGARGLSKQGDAAPQQVVHHNLGDRMGRVGLGWVG